MNFYKLSNNIQIPAIGFGTWNLENGSAATEVVLNAISSGYRMFDCAYSYGNDFFIGKALKKSELNRNEFFIINKVWNDFRTQEQVVDVCKKSLKLMKLDYFDLYLIHWPEKKENPMWKEINYNAWKGMEQLYNEGLVKSIGVSNFDISQIEALKEKGSTILPMVNQIEIHPGFNQMEVIDYCKQNNIIVQGWSPLGSGDVFENETLKNISKKYNKSISQICLRWSVQKGIIPIPKTKNVERMGENINIFDFVIGDADMELINNITNVDHSKFNY